MIHRIEVIGFTPTLILSFKKNGQVENMQLSGSLIECFKQLQIENFGDIVGRKYDVNFIEKDGKYTMQDIKLIDDRQITYADFKNLYDYTMDTQKDIHKIMKHLNIETNPTKK